MKHSYGDDLKRYIESRKTLSIEDAAADVFPSVMARLVIKHTYSADDYEDFEQEAMLRIVAVALKPSESKLGGIDSPAEEFRFLFRVGFNRIRDCGRRVWRDNGGLLGKTDPLPEEYEEERPALLPLAMVTRDSYAFFVGFSPEEEALARLILPDLYDPDKVAPILAADVATKTTALLGLKRKIRQALHTSDTIAWENPYA